MNHREPLGSLVLGVLLHRLGDQGGEGRLIALAVTTIAAIGKIGLNRPRSVPPVRLGCGRWPVQGSLALPARPRPGCVAVQLLHSNRLFHTPDPERVQAGLHCGRIPAYVAIHGDQDLPPFSVTGLGS